VFIIKRYESINPLRGNKPITNTKFIERYLEFPFLFTAQSKAWVCVRSLAGIVGSNPAWGQGNLSLVSVVFCNVEVFVSG
jgi:hypothetical protein